MNRYSKLLRKRIRKQEVEENFAFQDIDWLAYALIWLCWLTILIIAFIYA
jgi:polyferredoxin